MDAVNNSPTIDFQSVLHACLNLQRTCTHLQVVHQVLRPFTQRAEEDDPPTALQQQQLVEALRATLTASASAAATALMPTLHGRAALHTLTSLAL
jgi:hypothetical protein